MAKSQGTAAFESLVNQRNKDMMLKHRGTKNQFQEFGGPDGKYFGRIHQMVLDTFEMEQYDSNGNKTGKKVNTPRVQFRGTTICADDLTIPVAEAERFKGEPLNIMYLLGSDDDYKRFYGDLETIGVDTKLMVLLEQDKTDANQYTWAEVAESLTETKPFCSFVVSTSKKSQRKNCYYRGNLVQQDIEDRLGHPLDEVVTEYVETESQEGLTVPFDSGSGEGTEEQVGGEEEAPVWDEEKKLWHMLSTDLWYNEEGVQVELPKVKVPPKRQPPASFQQKKEEVKSTVRKPGSIMRK
jgi:hypothetical protein